MLTEGRDADNKKEESKLHDVAGEGRQHILMMRRVNDINNVRNIFFLKIRIPECCFRTHFRRIAKVPNLSE